MSGVTVIVEDDDYRHVFTAPDGVAWEREWDGPDMAPFHTLRFRQGTLIQIDKAIYDLPAPHVEADCE